MSDIILAKDIVKRYSGHTALDGVSLKVPKGTIFGLLGPNGAGKTTLIRIINQIIAPDSGEVFFNGKKLTPDITRCIGYLPEERGLYKKMKVGEQALYLAMLKGMKEKEAKDKLKKWFSKFDMGDWWNKKVEELSKGMQQKVQFIVTVLHEPELLILDEPFSGFDPINAELIKTELLRMCKEGATIILSTHNMSSVEELCNHITLINNAKTVLAGSVNGLKQQYKLHIWEIITDSSATKFPGQLEGFELINISDEHDKTKATVKIPAGKTSNDLLEYLLPLCNIYGLREVLPTMSEIFISVVNSDKSQPNG